MNFEDFRKDLEAQILSIAKFELLEFHFKPSSFGNGLVAYRIKGRNHKFVFDGRENELTWSISKPHQKYFGADMTFFKRIDRLELSLDELEKGIKT